MNTKWQCRVAPSLGGGFAGTPSEVWGTEDYTNETDPAVFFGLYGLPDFYSLWRHKGEKAVLWAGSDILHMSNGYWLDEVGEIKIQDSAIPEWIGKHCDNYCENNTERELLARSGIKAKVIPSFLGNVDDYQQQEIEPRKYYTSVSGDDFHTYGWHEIDQWAATYPKCEFHLYGNTKEWISGEKNVFVHGRMSQDEMNAQIKTMTGALRLTKFDGFSEIIAKSILWGQWPVSPYIDYELVDPVIVNRKGTNSKARNHYLKIINQYPWNVHIN